VVQIGYQTLENDFRAKILSDGQKYVLSSVEEFRQPDKKPWCDRQLCCTAWIPGWNTGKFTEAALLSAVESDHFERVGPDN
jgi:hypothetical protein